MNISVTVGVVRRYDYSVGAKSEDPARALQYHIRRKDALHDVLDNDPDIKVADWGKTDDTQPHEYVEILLGVAAPVVFQYAVVPGIEWLGLKLAEKGVDTAVIELAKTVVARLRPKQEKKEILDFVIKLPDGTEIHVDPPDTYATVKINFADGTVQSLEYLKMDGPSDQVSAS